MPRYRASASRTSVSSATGAISENSIVFSASGGHSHDGSNSSLIDTMKYSVWDFPVNTVYSTSPRAARQEGHIQQFRSFITNHVNNNVLEPAGIVLGENVINANNIIAGSINSNLIAANTIVAGNIAANTITTDLLATDAITSLNYSYTSGNFTTAGSFFDLSDGSIRTDSFYLDGSGNMYIAGDVVIGSTAASTIESGSASGATSLQPGEAASDVNNNTTTISGGKIRTGDIESTGFVRGSGTYSTTGTRFDLDSGDIISPNFRLFSNGVIYAQSGNFTGTVNASGGTFTGKITAGLTEVGTNIRGAADYAGIALRNDSWDNAWVRRSDNSVYFRAGSSTKYIQVDTAGTTTIQFPNFSVDNSGNITATGATITGTINATSGSFGSFSISGTKLTSEGSYPNNYMEFLNYGDLYIYSKPTSGGHLGQTWRTYAVGEWIQIERTDVGSNHFTKLGNWWAGDGTALSLAYAGDEHAILSVINDYGTLELKDTSNNNKIVLSGQYGNATLDGDVVVGGKLKGQGSAGYSGSWSTQQIQSINTGAANAGIAIRAGNNTGTVQLRVGYNFPVLYIRNHDDSGNAPLQAGSINVEQITSTTTYNTPHVTSGRNVYVLSTGVFGYYASSIKTKKNIEPIHYGLADVMAINPVSFEYIKNEGERHIGMIEEELREIVPEACVYNEDDPDFISSINYSHLTSVLIKAIQDLKNEVDDLRSQIFNFSN